MKTIWLAGLVLGGALTASGQLLPAQRWADFEQMAANVARVYAPYEWKRERLGYDALALRPWLDRVWAAQTDLEYFEICAEYLANLRDLHTGFSLPSNHVAEIGVWVDLYDGQVLIDFVDRSELPASQYPFEVGDRVVVVDGQRVEDWVERVSKLQSFGDERATRRWAVDQLFYRTQAAIPTMRMSPGSVATVFIERRRTGEVERYSLPWKVTGTPYTVSGPVPLPGIGITEAGARGEAGLAEEAEEAPRPRRAAEAFANRAAPRYKRLRGFGSAIPSFEMPAGFVRRQGQTAGSLIYSGTFEAEEYRIGFLRIPSFPTSTFTQSTMLRQIDTELAYFRDNADGLVVDVMRNPGGSVCLTNDILRRLIPVEFRTLADEFRPTLEIVRLFRQDVEDAKFFGADEVTIAFLEGFLRDVETAYYEPRGRTGPLPACGLSLDLQPLPGYAGPMLVLIDEFSVSSADAFPAILQDSNRALMYGRRTPGGGGLSMEKPLGIFGEASATLTVTLGIRPKTTDFPGLPRTNTLENNGAWPDFEDDIMTAENLLSGGKPFVEGFTRAMIEHIQRTRGTESAAGHGRAVRVRQ